MSKRFLSQRRWAVAGDVLNAAKPASRVVAALNGQGVEGRTVALVNPRDDSGACFKSVEAIDGEFDVLNLCINSKMGLTLLEEAAAKGVKQVFIQPGAGSPDIEALAEKRGIEVFNGCVMVELGAH
tara:strand:- start:603 stop:980 length:378 start_codon:yes stop_codon:yes gene_type:complete